MFRLALVAVLMWWWCHQRFRGACLQCRTWVLNCGVLSTAAKPEGRRSGEVSSRLPPPAGATPSSASPAAPRGPSWACASGTEATRTPSATVAPPPLPDQLRPSFTSLRGSRGVLGEYNLQGQVGLNQRNRKRSSRHVCSGDELSRPGCRGAQAHPHCQAAQ